MRTGSKYKELEPVTESQVTEQPISVPNKSELISEAAVSEADVQLVVQQLIIGQHGRAS